MTRPAIRSTARTAIERLIETPARFPLALACAALATLSLIGLIHDVPYSDPVGRLLLVCVLGFFVALAAKSAAECRGWPTWWSVALAVGGIALIAVKVFWGTAKLQPSSGAILFLGPAVVLLATVAPFLGRGTDADFWAFNRTAILSAVFSGAGALVLFLGVSAAIGATEYLFRIDFPSRVWGDTAAVSFGFVWPWLLLSAIPRDYRAGDIAGMKWMERLATFILVPLALLYVVILYVYVARIAGLWELPRGRVAYIVAGCALFGAATHLIVYGLRDMGAQVVRLYHRLFYPLLLVPTVLMGVGVFTRIGEYGVTESRYAVVLLALWLAAMSALHLAPVRQRLVWVPASLSVLAFLASFGPWGAENVSLSSQMARLTALLDRNGVLAGGKVTPAGQRLDGRDAKDISSIVRYLDSTGRRTELAPLFSSAGVAFDPDRPAQALVESLGVRYYNRWSRPGTKRFYIRNRAMRGISVGYNPRRAVTDVSGFRDMAFVAFRTRKGKDSEVYFAGSERRLRMSLDPDSGQLSIRDFHRKRTAVLDLHPLVRKWRKRGKSKSKHRLGEDMTVRLSQGGMRLRLYFTNVTGDIVDGEPRITNLKLIILVGEASKG